MTGMLAHAGRENQEQGTGERDFLRNVDLDSFFVAAPAGLALFDRECRYVKVSQTLADIAGRSVEEHLGRMPRDLLPAPLAAEIEEGLGRTMATGAPLLNVEISAELPPRSGMVRHWLHSQFPVHDGTGNIVGAGAIVVETTSFRQLAASSGQNAQLFREIAENIQCVFWVSDPDSRQTLYISPAYEEIWGRSCEDVYTRHASWLEAVHPDDLDLLRAKHLSPDYGAHPLEYRIIRPNGETRWIRSRVFKVHDEAGREYRRVGIAEDITAHMEVLDRLQDSETRYRMLFETSTDGVSIYALAGSGGEQQLIDCNASYAKLAGRGKTELFELTDIRGLKQFSDQTRGREGRSPSLGLLGTGRCAGLYSWQRPDGRTNFIECRGNLCSLNGTEFMHCVHRDITRAKLAEEKIRHLSRRMIEVVEEEQKRIARNLHDEFGQRLLFLRHRLDAFQKKVLAAGMPELPEFREIEGLIDAIGAAVRSVTNRLRPDVLDNLGFLPALEWGLRDFGDRYPWVRLSFEMAGAWRKMPPEYEIALYRVFQEGLTNIGKHAGAAAISVRLVFSYPAVIMIVADDGCGFDQESPAGVGPLPQGGIGFRSMRERMLAIGGTFAVRSRRGEGTTLRAEVEWRDGEEAAGQAYLHFGTMRAGCP